MAYQPGELKRLVGAPGKPSIWVYTSDDAVNTVRGANYFDDAKRRRMQVGDRVWVRVNDSAGDPIAAQQMMTVVAVTSSGADLSDGDAVTLTNT